MKGFILISLFAGFFLLFHEAKLLERLGSWAKRARSDMDASARLRILEERKKLLSLQEEHSILWAIENSLRYSGLRQRFPGLTLEWWLLGNLAVLGTAFVLTAALFGILPAAVVCMLIFAAETWILRSCRIRNLRRVNEELLKLLDFLGNYSITAGEVTSVLNQVSRYMEEPIRGALELCCLEAGMTGDTGTALLVMADYIEHPKFKELARNMEISVRYCADFSAMVRSSRRSMREYLRVQQERKGMLREALINMLLLLGMSLIVLTIVGSLISFSIWKFLWGSLPGRFALAVVGGILALFMGQVRRIQV